MSNETRPIILTALIAAPNAHVSVKLELPGSTTQGNLHMACIQALRNQAPEHSSSPISALKYDVRANA